MVWVPHSSSTHLKPARLRYRPFPRQTDDSASLSLSESPPLHPINARTASFCTEMRTPIATAPRGTTPVLIPDSSDAELSNGCMMVVPIAPAMVPYRRAIGNGGGPEGEWSGE